MNKIELMSYHLTILDNYLENRNVDSFKSNNIQHTSIIEIIDFFKSFFTTRNTLNLSKVSMARMDLFIKKWSNDLYTSLSINEFDETLIDILFIEVEHIFGLIIEELYGETALSNFLYVEPGDIDY